MGLLEDLGKALGDSVRKNMESYNRTSSRNLDRLSDQDLYKKCKDAISRRDFGAARAYGDEYKSRRDET